MQILSKLMKNNKKEGKITKGKSENVENTEKHKALR